MALSKKHYLFCKVIIALGNDEPMKIFDEPSLLHLTPIEKTVLWGYKHNFLMLDDNGRKAEHKRIEAIYFNGTDEEMLQEYEKDIPESHLKINKKEFIKIKADISMGFIDDFINKYADLTEEQQMKLQMYTQWVQLHFYCYLMENVHLKNGH